MDTYSEFQFSGRSLNAKEGVNSILKLRPDVVLLNLDENDFNSLDLICELHTYLRELPYVIAISKTKERAYAAIKQNCFDYWLATCDELEIRKSLMRLKKTFSKKSEPQKLCLKTYRDYHYVDTDEILYLKADNNATDVFMADGSKVNAYKSLKKFEQQLPGNFVRVHQSYMLNTKHVERINYGKAICSLKGQNMQLPFSKTYRENIDQLKSRLSKNSISSLF